MSQKELLPVFLFIVAAMTLRVFLPAHDEPDFDSRISRISQNKADLLTPVTGLIANYIGESEMYEWRCQFDYSMSSLTQKVEGNCIDFGGLFIQRYIWILISNFPLLFILAYRGRIQKLLSGSNMLDRGEYRKRFDAITIAIMLPSSLYLLGLVSFETIFMSTSLLVLVAINNISIFFLLIAYLALHDLHNTILVIIFTLMIKFFNSSYSLSNKWIAGIFGLIIVVIAYFAGDLIVELYSFFTGDSKGREILASAQDLGDDKYPKLLRPGIVGLSLIFLTAHGLKAWVTYACIFGYCVMATYFLFKNIFNEKLRKKINLSTLGQSGKSVMHIEPWAVAMAIIVFCFAVVLILPSYAYGKYYIFLSPFLMYFAQSFFRRKTMLFGVVLINFLVMLDIFLAFL
jgi:hypothetical protein